MLFQAYIDDSYTPNGEFVLAGHVATAEAWAEFSKDWENILPAGTLSKSGWYHFKMKEMAANADRMKRLPGFWWTIQKHVVVSLSCRINIEELRRARARIYVPGGQIDWGFWSNPYLAATRCLLDMFHNNRHKIEKRIPVDQPVDFIFDEQTEKAVILEAWDRYIASRSVEIRALYGATPRFENDQRFLPLQAADFWAWWVREWSESGGIEEKMKTLDFGEWRGRDHTTKHMVTHYSFNENQIAHELQKGTSAMLPGRPIYDVTFSPIRNWPAKSS